MSSLHIEQARLFTIVDSSHDAIVGKDLDGVITSWNAAAEHIFGYTAAEVVGRPITFLFPEDRKDEAKVILGKLRGGERVDHFESVRMTKDGRLINVSLTISPIRDATGQIIGIAKIARDITPAKQAAVAIRESEEKFRQLANAMPQIVFTARPDGDVDFYNERWYALTGRSVGDGGHESWETILHRDDSQACLNAWNHSVATGEPFQIECRFKDQKTGDYRWHLGRAVAIKDESNQVVRWNGTFTDIEDQKLTAQRHIESEARFRQLADAMPQLACMGRPDGFIYWYNRRWFEYTGTTPESMEGWGWQSAHDPAELPRVLERWRKSIASGKTFEMVFPLRGADGKFRRFLTRVEPFRDDEGRCIHWFGTNTDIEDQKCAEEALRLSEANVRLLNESLEQRVRERTAELRTQAKLIDLADDAIVVRGGDGTIFSWNQGAERIYGWAKDEAVGRTSHDLLKTEFPRPLSEIEEHLASFGSWAGELTHECRDGSKIVVASRWVLDRNGADDRTVLEINGNVTKQRAAEVALRRAKDTAESAARAKGDFLANMSHEIRTPMNGVIGMTELLLDTNLNDLQRSYAETIRGSGEALLTVINDILDFSKIEAGKLTLESTDFDLGILMEEVADMLAPRVHQKGLELNVRVAADIPVPLVGDPVRVRQVLTNLVGNAVKFTERGEVNLEANLVSEDGEGVTVNVSVRDTGIGIASARQADVFESFTQIEGGSQRKYGGTGLGLAICRNLVDLMQGEIGLDSIPGKGSTFWFKLNLGRGISSPEALSTNIMGLRVMVVDDHETNRTIAAEALRSWSCRPEVVGSGAEACAKLLIAPDNDPYALILLDHLMPGMDGVRTAEVIRSIPKLADVPIVLLTSVGANEELEDLEGGLFTAKLIKPIRRSQLYSAVCRAVTPDVPDRKHKRGPDEMTVDPALNLRVLLAEDNDVNQRVAIGILERFGCSIDTAENGRQALELLDYGIHDLVLMDVQMPEMDGLSSTAAIRIQEMGTGRHIPIIAMTAHAMQGDREKCLAAGMDGYLTKPLRRGPLREVLLSLGIGAKTSAENVVLSPPSEERAWFVDSLRESCNDDPRLVSEILKVMLKGTPERMARLESAIEGRSGSRISWEAHALRGAFLTVGADDLASACQDLVTLAAIDEFAPIESIYSSVRDKWIRLQKEVAEYIETQPIGLTDGA